MKRNIRKVTMGTVTFTGEEARKILLKAARAPADARVVVLAYGGQSTETIEVSGNDSGVKVTW